MAYCTRADIEARYRKANVTAWADLDNTRDASAISTAISNAIAEADAEIDLRLRDGPYTLPFSPVPEHINRLATMLSGVILHDARGISGRLTSVREWVYVELAKLKDSDRRLDADTVELAPSIVSIDRVT